METFNPISQKSPISSLRFRRRNDFDKFLKFIKVETKNLKGEKEPAGRGVKKIISNVAKGGIGLGFIIGLFSKKRSEEDFSNKLDISASRLDFTIAPSTPLFRQDASTRKKPERFKPLKSKAKITGNDVLTFRKGKAVDPTSARRQVQVVDKKSGKVIKKQLVTKDIASVKGEKPRTLERTKLRTTLNVTQSDGFRSTGQGTKGSGIKYGSGDARFESGSFDPSNAEGSFRNRGGRNINKRFFNESKIPKAIIDEVRRINKTLNDRKLTETKETRLLNRLEQIRKNQGGKISGISGNFKLTRPGTFNFSIPNPFNRFNTVDTPMMSKNTFKKGAFSKIFNPKVTRDTILGLPTKGKFFTKAAMFFNHPIPKTIGFLLTAYEGYQEGKGIFNLKDNIITNLIDLGISVNNAINADDPSKMRLFIGESSIPERRLMQIRRNKKIMELKNAQNDQANNTVLIPMNTGNGQEGTPTNIPNPNSSSSNIAFNTDRLNIGDMVFLSKLSVG